MDVRLGARRREGGVKSNSAGRDIERLAGQSAPHPQFVDNRIERQWMRTGPAFLAAPVLQVFQERPKALYERRRGLLQGMQPSLASIGRLDVNHYLREAHGRGLRRTPVDRDLKAGQPCRQALPKVSIGPDLQIN